MNTNFISIESFLSTVHSPEALFGTPDDVRSTYLEMAKNLHPDVCKHADAARAFAHLKDLYQAAVAKIEGGHWGYAGAVEVVGLGGANERVNYQSEHKFELGSAFVASNEVVYLTHDDHRDLRQNYIRAAASFTFAGAEMEKEVRRYLPAVRSATKATIRVPKTPDLLSLRDAIKHAGGSLDPQHVAWIVSSLYNLCCYLSYAKLTHNDISPDTYFISPKYHSGALLGGWWYSVPHGKPIARVPARTFAVLPFKVKTSKRASHTTDAELVLATGREMLGDITGKKLRADTPKPMREWLTSVAVENPIENYKRWGDVLTESFGPRRFVEMRLDERALYNR